MNTYYIAGYPISDELYHHGIKGQKWGIRRYQNPDGTLTAAGKARYGTIENFNKAQSEKKSRSIGTKIKESSTQVVNKSKNALKNEKIRKAVKIGAVAAGTALAAYGAYKLGKHINDASTLNILSKGQDRVDYYLNYESDMMLNSNPKTRNYDYATKLAFKSGGVETIQKQTNQELQNARESFKKTLKNAQEWHNQSKEYKDRYKHLIGK